MTVRELLIDTAVLVVVAVLLFVSYRFFTYSIAALARQIPFVTAGIMSSFIGLISLTGAVAIMRDWLIARKSCKE